MSQAVGLLGTTNETVRNCRHSFLGRALLVTTCPVRARPFRRPKCALHSPTHSGAKMNAVPQGENPLKGVPPETRRF
jgi:hypothetical protein